MRIRAFSLNLKQTFCLQLERDWDDAVHFPLFVAREKAVVKGSVCLPYFELVFCHTISEHLKLVTETCLEHIQGNLLDYVFDFKGNKTSYFFPNCLDKFEKCAKMMNLRKMQGTECLSLVIKYLYFNSPRTSCTT